jgi:hypothetical protein
MHCKRKYLMDIGKWDTLNVHLTNRYITKKGWDTDAHGILGLYHYKQCIHILSSFRGHHIIFILHSSICIIICKGLKIKKIKKTCNYQMHECKEWRW